VNVTMLPIEDLTTLNVLSVLVGSCFMTTVANACSTMFYKGADGDAVVVCGSPGEIANDAVGNNMFQFASSTYCVLCLLVLFVTVVLNVLAALCSQHSFK